MKKQNDWILFLCLLVSLILPSRFSLADQDQGAQSPTLAPEDEYNAALESVNNRLNQIHETHLCPGANLAISCGNNICEPALGENEETCPADCVTAPVKSYNSQTFCKDVKRLFIPESIADVQAEVQFAIKSGLHVRIIGNSHSVNSQLCTDGIVISTQKLTHILGIETFRGQETVLVEPGVLMGDLMDWLDTQNRTLGYSIVGFRGVSIGGAIATGAHESSPRQSAVLSDAVESIMLVKADGSIQEYYDDNSDTFKALRNNLGMLGAVVQIRLRIMPQFNLHVKLKYEADQNLFKKNLIDEMSKCDFSLINWFPEAGKIIKTCGMETQKKAEAGAENISLKPSIPQSLIKPYKVALQFGACFPDLNQLIEDLSYATFRLQPSFVKLNDHGKLVSSNDVIGPSHKMMSSEVSVDGKRAFNRDWEFAVPKSQVNSLLKVIQEVLLENEVSLPLKGIFIRFAQSQDRSLLSHVTSGGSFNQGETVAIIEFPVYRPKAFSSGQEERYFRPYEKLAHLIIEKFHGRAHWGKNEDWIFSEENQIGTFGDKLTRFKNVVHQLDPNGVFSNDFSKKIGF